MSQQNLEFRPREAARASDPVTSVMAAERVAPHVGEGRMRALRCFYEKSDEDLDDFQLSEMTGLKQTSVGKRRLELELAGYVVRTGRRMSPSVLCSSVVNAYRITEAGINFYARSNVG